MGRRSNLSGGISLRWTAALECAHELANRPYTSGRPAPMPRPGRRVRVVRTQTSLERFLSILDAHDLLGVDGFLADDVQLVVIDDHVEPGGAAILRWLAEHAPSQVTLLAGAHAPPIVDARRYSASVRGVLPDGRAVSEVDLAGLTTNLDDPTLEPEHVPLLELAAIS